MISASVTREEALADETNQNLSKQSLFVVTYNPMLPNIPEILHEAQPILYASERCTEIFKNVPLLTYRRARNLSDIFSSKRLPAPKSHNPTSSQTYHFSGEGCTVNFFFFIKPKYNITVKP